jgi:F0F1-type ATP synthase assembly protein I
MGAIMFIGTYSGYRLDKHFANSTPYFTLALAILSIAVAFYITLKDLFRPKK